MEHAVPALPRNLADRWGVDSVVLIADTRTSHVYRVRQRGGSSAIAKLLKPVGLHELPGIDLLGWLDGKGAVRLLDRSDNACLLEDAGMLTLREWRLEHGETDANGVIVSVLRKLHSASPTAPPSDLLPLRQHFRALFERAARPDGSELSALLRRCAAVAESLLSAQIDVRPLHGDLHHENIISGGQRGWLAIDPQGLIGDPAYEVANVFGNPEGAFEDIIDPRRIVALAKLFAPVIGCGEEKILRYAIAHAGLSICWSLQDGGGLSGNQNAFERHAFAEAAIRLLEDGAFISA